MGGLAVIKELQSLIPGPEPSHQRSLGQYQVFGQWSILDFPFTAILASAHSRQSLLQSEEQEHGEVIG